MGHQEYFGRKFYKDHTTGYWISTNEPKIRAHRWVWINIHGKIPKGYHIHHKNKDKSDNRIKNLELLERSRHLSIHSLEPCNVERSRKWMDEIRPLTKEWHRSEEGRTWHKLHAIKNKFGKNDPKNYLCQCCGTSFESTKISRTYFCSNACKSKFRRDSGVDNIEKTCERCMKIFLSSKYAKTRFCSRSCAH